MAEAAVRQATYAELEAVPAHLVAEIIDGVLETHPRPRPRHAMAASDLSTLLGTPFRYGRGGPGGWIFMIEPELHLGAHVVVPDLAAWRRERVPTDLEAAHIEIAPDWVCEILSPSTVRLDRGRKRRIDAQGKIGPRWQLDPSAGVL
jgi:Uma2 family endonuclease